MDSGLRPFNIKPLKIKKIKIPSLRGALPRKRDVARQVNPFSRIREPISANIKNTVRKRARNKCEWSGCNEGRYLDFHHKNMKNDDNRVSNIVLLCPTHHRAWHDKYKKVSHKGMMGEEVEAKIVKRDKYKEEKRRMTDKHSLIPKFELGDFR